MTATSDMLLILAVFIGLLMSGVFIPFAVGIASVAYLLIAMGPAGLKGVGLVIWGSADSFTLTAMPLFMLMSDVLLRSGVGDRVYRGLSVLVARLPGGLLQTNLVGCAVFAAVSGSSLATAAAIGTVAVPKLKEFGYDDRIATGSIAAGGTLGILIPPSLAFIIYGSFTETSVAKLFIAGIVPGLVLTALFMVYVAAMALLRPSLAPAASGAGRSSAGVVGDVLPFCLLIGGVIGGIYSGIVTPTEAAALGALLAIVIGWTLGNLTLATLWQSLIQTVRITGAVMLIVVTAMLFAFATGMAGLPQALVATLTGLGLTKTGFLIAVILIYLALGMMMESTGILVITVPLLFPLVQFYGIDLIWFGVILVILIEIGMITPPFGINLFMLQSLRGRGQLGDVVMGAAPFVLIMLMMIGVLVAVPDLATWLPEMMSAR